MNNQPINEVTSHKHLGIFFSTNFTWHSHIDHITSKAWTRINIMRKLKLTLDYNSLGINYILFIRPILEYGDIVWYNCTQYEKGEIEKIQLQAARIVTDATKLISKQRIIRLGNISVPTFTTLSHSILQKEKQFHTTVPL